MPQTPPAPALQGPALLASLTLFWGINWPAMKQAVAAIEPWTFRSLCLGIGAAGLLAVARAGGRSLRIPRADWKPLLLASFLNITLWHLATAFALTLMGAGRAAIVAYTMPVWATILSAVVLRERLTWPRLAGLGLGLLALAILLAPDLGRVGAAPWGVALMLVAALTWAAGTVTMKKVRWQLDTVRLAGWQLLIGGLPVFLGTALIGRPASLMEAGPASLAAALYGATIPMVYCQYAWFRIIALYPANVAAISTLAIPVVGVFSSALVLGEPLGAAEAAALALVVAALVMVLLVRAPPAR